MPRLSSPTKILIDNQTVDYVQSVQIHSDRLEMGTLEPITLKSLPRERFVEYEEPLSVTLLEKTTVFRARHLPELTYEFGITHD